MKKNDAFSSQVFRLQFMELNAEMYRQRKETVNYYFKTNWKWIVVLSFLAITLKMGIRF